jgi:hypothetical protein
MNKLFVSEALLNLNLDSFKKTKDIKGNYLAYLSGFEWDFFGCVRYAQKLQLNSVKERMERLGKKLATKYKGNEVRLFYAVEQNSDLSGYHAHFLLWLDVDDKTAIIRFNENSLRGKSDNQTLNTYLERFNLDQGGVAYILKEINLNLDVFDLIWKRRDDLLVTLQLLRELENWDAHHEYLACILVRFFPENLQIR